jgi:glycosyltransferase involved in cell wall biosynthesis
MVFIFIHQNFPGQYLSIVRHLGQQPAHRVYFITQSGQTEIPGVRKIVYRPQAMLPCSCQSYTAVFDHAVRAGVAVAEVCRALRADGIVPDIVVGHCGWGETLFVKDVFPGVPVLSCFEFFYHSAGVDVGFDPEFARPAEHDGIRLSVRNAVNRLSFSSSTWGHSATAWQRSLFPASMQERISALHEGVDTERVRPNPQAWVKLAGANPILTRRDEVITYVARNLEPYRGFHIFMRAVADLLRRRPRAHVLVVGGDGFSYGNPPPYGGTYREMMLAELGPRLDRDRVHFLGHVSYETYLNVLQVSSVHVYLTYPFVLSWSFVEALAAGCLIVGSATAPVLEWLRDGENGLLVDFFSPQALCERIEAVLEDPERLQPLRDAARETAVRMLDLRSQMLPRWLTLLGDLIDRRLPTAQPPEPGPATAAQIL